ncbi:MAG: TetR/AcrR family transcriptional regulator [Deltaproteobacteria bacterium]|nr:TetR/AcrR family transcriptional regulator [Deltaproteobacteria bacterium]MBW1929340.1 TetR/AcrR family transcriptional regulator [Deltaproteobacteria bacterium]MBW2025154.1 TetR/AcrR family transcriptional regulator [Deltaproteobacteria bacterium]MBW2125988.1 TetR/AcrR family transcriptional regulator [Deltaproteobacteria bacterium]
MEQEELKKQKEEAIFQAALRVIKEKGFHKARMADIAAEAGTSYGLVYHYFGSKEELFEAIQRRWWGKLFELMKDPSESSLSVPEKLGRIIEYFLGTYHHNPELATIFITQISRSTTNLTPERLAHFKGFMEMTQNVIKEGQDQGLLRNDIPSRYLTYIFLGSLETFVSAMVLVDQKIKDTAQKNRIAKGILEVFLNGARNQTNK